MTVHKPVLLKKLLEIVKPSPDKSILDATFGGGGHSIPFAKAGAAVTSIEKDLLAVREGERLLNSTACLVPSHIEEGEPKSFSFPSGGSLKLIHGSFAQISSLVGLSNYHVILFDLGLSSDQLESDRGFSFQRDSPLDMRFDPSTQGVTAADLLAVLGEKQLFEILISYSQEQHARTISRSIVRERKLKSIATTSQLTNIILKIIPRQGKIHPATKTFQALRIAVNRELDELEAGLTQAWDHLNPNGFIAAISFHSGEDKVIKTFTKLISTQTKTQLIKPDQEEINANPRSRSAKLRIIQKP